MRAPRGGVVSRMVALALAGAALAAGVGDAGAVARGGLVARARADEAWAAEFEAVCSRTQDAMTIPSDELRSLIRRADALRRQIEALDETRRKVYGRRLKVCRDLYAFVLGSREGG